MNEPSHRFQLEQTAPNPVPDIPRGIHNMQANGECATALSAADAPTYLKAAGWTADLHDVPNAPCDTYITIARHTRGSVIKRTDRNMGEAKKGQITVFSGLENSVWRSQGELTFEHFYLDRNLLSWVARDIGLDRDTNNDPIEFMGANIPALSLLLDQVSDTLLYGEPDPLVSDAWGIALADLLLRNSGLARLAPDQKVPCPLTAHRLRTVIDLIESHLDENISLQWLAREVGCSEYFFCRAFKSVTGLTPHQYVIERRVARARELLEESKETIADIAYAVGFSSQSHMTETFKSRTGTTPGAYRKSRRS